MKKITNAAIRYKFRKDPELYVLTGKHHKDLFKAISDDMDDIVLYEEGFIVNDTYFVDCFEAKKIAVAAGQVAAPVGEAEAMLSSEEIW